MTNQNHIKFHKCSCAAIASVELGNVSIVALMCTTIEGGEIFMRFRSRIMSRERCEINSCLLLFPPPSVEVCSASTILWNHNRLTAKQFPYLFQVFHSFHSLRIATFEGKCFSSCVAVPFDVALQK